MEQHFGDEKASYGGLLRNPSRTFLMNHCIDQRLTCFCHCHVSLGVSNPGGLTRKRLDVVVLDDASRLFPIKTTPGARLRNTFQPWPSRDWLRRRSTAALSVTTTTRGASRRAFSTRSLAARGRGSARDGNARLAAGLHSPEQFCGTAGFIVFLKTDSTNRGKEVPVFGPLSLRTLLDLATRLPHLRELDFPSLREHLPIAFASQALRTFPRVWAGPWRDSRAEFAQGVRHAMPLLPALTKARLWFWKPYPQDDAFDQAAQMPNLVTASEFEEMDPVSLGLRDLGSRLEELDIRALITPDLFPSGGGSTSWPHMRHLKVEFYPCAPDGCWYFSGPRGENPYATGFPVTEEHYRPGPKDDEKMHVLLSDEEEENRSGEDLYILRQPDMFRTLPVAEHINPLVLAFARSLQRMPSLEDTYLFTWLTWRPSEERAQEYEGSDDAPPFVEGEATMFRWGVRYDAPKGDGKAKVRWQVGSWRPASEVLKAFEDLVGREGEDMEWEAFEFAEERELDPAYFT